LSAVLAVLLVMKSPPKSDFHWLQQEPVCVVTSEGLRSILLFLASETILSKDEKKKAGLDCSSW